MMVDNRVTNNERSDQELDPSQSPDDNQQQLSYTPSTHENLRDDEVQPFLQRRFDQHNRDEASVEWITGDSHDAKATANPMAAENINLREIPASPEPVNEDEFPWFSGEELDELHSRWSLIQVQFVNEPRSAVEQAEALLAETSERVKQKLSDQQNTLDQQWLNHDDISTEELRLTLQNYRSCLNHLLKL